MLANVKMAQGSSTSGLGTATRLSLTGLDAELQKHLNHQVEVTGHLSAAGAMSGSSATGAPAATGSTASTSGSGSRSGSGSEMNTSDMPQLHATSVKMIAATCPAQ